MVRILKDSPERVVPRGDAKLSSKCTEAAYIPHTSQSRGACVVLSSRMPKFLEAVRILENCPERVVLRDGVCSAEGRRHHPGHRASRNV